MNIPLKTNEPELIPVVMIACGWVVKPSCSDCGFESSLFNTLPSCHHKMAFKSSYLLFYPKQPYFCQADWKGGLGQRFVSCCLIFNHVFCYLRISFSSSPCCEFLQGIHKEVASN